jgi:hypothetical protein
MRILRILKIWVTNFRSMVPRPYKCKLSDWCGFTMCPHAPIAIRVHVKLRLFSAGRGLLVRRGKASPPFTIPISLMGPQGRIGVPVRNHITKNNFNTTSIVGNIRFTVLYFNKPSPHTSLMLIILYSLDCLIRSSRVTDWPILEWLTDWLLDYWLLTPIYRGFEKR